MRLTDRLSDHEFAGVLEDFIATNFEQDTNLTNLADLIAWNESHVDLAMPARKEAYSLV